MSSYSLHPVANTVQQHRMKSKAALVNPGWVIGNLVYNDGQHKQDRWARKGYAKIFPNVVAHTKANKERKSYRVCFRTFHQPK